MRHTLFILLLLGAGHAGAQDTLPERGPRITFDQVVQLFGMIPEGGDGQCTFTFTNTGDEPLVLTSCLSSCGCVVPTWDRDPVAPGDTGRVRVRYDTKRVGPFSKSVTVRSNAVDHPMVVLTIKGEVRPSAALPAGQEER